MSTEDLEGAPECQEPWPRATGKVDNRKPEHTFPLAAPNPANGTWNPNRAFSPHPSAWILGHNLFFLWVLGI